MTARLAAEVAAGRLASDLAQHAAALRLDSLRDTLRGPPPVRSRLRAALPWLRDGLRKAPRGLYLWGGVGRGKTLLMDWFVESLPASGAAAERSHFYHFMRDMHAELGRIMDRASPLDTVAQRIAARTRLICLDEFFVADIADAMLLAGLLEGLFRRGVVLVATSNLRPRDLYQEGLQRQRFLPAIDLIEAHADVIHLDGGIDYRLRQLEQAPTYLDASLADTSGRLAERFRLLTVGAEALPATLTIDGRALRAVRLAHGTAWFEFDELCAGPRSQNDFIEIARRFPTVFIANIPALTGDDDDAARRFVMLIDEFYDRGVKIVVSAAAAPAALYRGERLRLEFERAASRLVEMQAQRYLAGQHRP